MSEINETIRSVRLDLEDTKNSIAEALVKIESAEQILEDIERKTNVGD